MMTVNLLNFTQDKQLSNFLSWAPFNSLEYLDFQSMFTNSLNENNTNNDYINATEIQQFKFSPDNFTCININIRSLNKNFHKLETLMAQLNFHPTVILVSETWLNDRKPLLFSLQGYKFIGLPGSKEIGGGVGIFIKDFLEYKLLSSYNLNVTNCEDIWLEVPLTKNKKIIIACVYRHPSYNFQTFQENITSKLENMNKHNLTYIIGGDFNINYLSKSTLVRNYKHEIESVGSNQIVKSATRFSPNCKKSLIDHLYTNLPETKIINHCICFEISDHLPSFTVIKSIKYNKSNHIKKIIREEKNFVPEDFLTELNEKLLLTVSTFNGLSGNDMWNSFENTFSSVLNKHAPLRQQTRSECKRNNKPWITRGILKSIKAKHKLYRTVIKNPIKSNWEKFKNYRNKLNRTIVMSKRSHFQQKIQQNQGNTKKLWKTLNEIVNRKPYRQKSDLQIVNNSGQLIKDSKQVSNLMNTYFASVGEKLSANITPPVNTNTNYLTGVNKVNDSMFLKLFTVNEMESYIRNLDTNKSTTTTSPPTKFIKLSTKIISPIITNIFNCCISEGIFPDKLKYAEIIPIYKQGDKTQSSNHRPISILSPFSKIFEIHLHKQINNFISKHNIFHPYQYGFRRGVSTDVAVSQITEDLATKMQNKLITCSVFIDLRKAFDTVNHQILISKLHNYGIRGQIGKLLENYLTNRTQVTIVNNAKSNPKLITCGVPQGSILGPLLFNLYINDLPNHSAATTRLFADDACLCFSHKDPNTLQTQINRELSKTNDWLKINKLTANYSKTNYIIFTKKRINFNFNIIMGGQVLERVNDTKYLGVTLDKDLNWKKNIEMVKSKVSRGCYIISKLRYYTNLETLKIIYYSLIYPHLMYCITSWGGTSKSSLAPLLRLQKKAIRLMTFNSFDTSSAPLFSQLQILPLDLIYNFNISTLFHKIYKNKLPTPKGLVLLSQTHNYNTRISSKSNYYQNFNSINLGQQTYISKGVKIWQTIPTDLKELPVYAFKKKIKIFFLNFLNDQISNL